MDNETVDITVSNTSNQIDTRQIDVEKDYKYTRGQLYSIIEKGQEAINGILELAQESEMPRAYEVAGQLIKNVADATDKLMDLQKKLLRLSGLFFSILYLFFVILFQKLLQFCSRTYK